MQPVHLDRLSLIKASALCMCLLALLACSSDCGIESGDVLELNETITVKVDARSFSIDNDLSNWRDISSRDFMGRQSQLTGDEFIPYVCSQGNHVFIAGNYSTFNLPSGATRWEIENLSEKNTELFVQAFRFGPGFLAVYRTSLTERENPVELWYFSEGERRLLLNADTIVLVKFEEGEGFLALASNYAHGSGEVVLYLFKEDILNIKKEVYRFDDEYRGYGFDDTGNLILVCNQTVHLIDRVSWKTKFVVPFRSKLSRFVAPATSTDSTILLGMHGCVLEISKKGNLTYKIPPGF